MDERFESSLIILFYSTLILGVTFLVMLAVSFIGMLRDHYCYELPPQEFFSDPKCERYWDYERD